MNNLKPFRTSNWRNLKMKFELNLAVKAVPMADVHLTIECNAEELSIMLSDPVYQELGQKFIREVNFAPKAQHHQNHSTNHGKANGNQLNDHFEHMRKVYEADRKARNNHDKAVDTAIRGLQDQVSGLIDLIILKNQSN